MSVPTNPIDFCTVADVVAVTGDTGMGAGISGDAIQTLITANSAGLLYEMGRTAILAANYTEVRNGNGMYAIMPYVRPIISVSQVQINGRITTQANGPTAFGWVNDKRLIYYRYGVFCQGIQNVSLTYRAGWETMPLDLKELCVDMVISRYRRRGREGVEQEAFGTPGAQSIKFSKSDIPQDQMDVLDNYRLRMESD